MTREELKEILPHREPMLLLDEATKIEDNTGGGQYIRCTATNGSCRAIFRATQWSRASSSAK